MSCPYVGVLRAAGSHPCTSRVVMGEHADAPRHNTDWEGKVHRQLGAVLDVVVKRNQAGLDQSR